jgi:hypothetical protein
MFIEEKTLQLVLVKHGDLVINKLVQAKELVPLLVELEDFQPIEFEPVIIIRHLVASKQQMCLFIIIIICLFRTIM